jgi:DNA-binding CsgD family transcriptional regulator
MSELDQRASRLTPREWRVIALVLEGVPTSQACESLGIAPGTFESHKQAIRRKLGIPRGERLERHLQAFAGRIPAAQEAEGRRAPAEPPPPRTSVSEAVEERRVRLLYRMTIDELLEVAGSAELRASLLEQTVKRMSGDDAGSATQEVDDLRRAAEEIRTIARRLLEEVRSRTG